jgi:hypothetical protein
MTLVRMALHVTLLRMPVLSTLLLQDMIWLVNIKWIVHHALQG